MLAVDRVEDAVAKWRRGVWTAREPEPPTDGIMLGIRELYAEKQQQVADSFQEPYKQWFKTDFQKPTDKDAIIAFWCGLAELNPEKG